MAIRIAVLASVPVLVGFLSPAPWRVIALSTVGGIYSVVTAIIAGIDEWRKLDGQKLQPRIFSPIAFALIGFLSLTAATMIGNLPAP